MHIVSLKRLRLFWEIDPDAEEPLRAWHGVARRAQWRTPVDIRVDYGSASFVGNNRVVFNIKGNDYRLIVWLHIRKAGYLSGLLAPTRNMIGSMPPGFKEPFTYATTNSQ